MKFKIVLWELPVFGECDTNAKPLASIEFEANEENATYIGGGHLFYNGHSPNDTFSRMYKLNPLNNEWEAFA